MMLASLIILIGARPFICSPAFPLINIIYLILLQSVIFIWICLRGGNKIGYIFPKFYYVFISIVLISFLISFNKNIALEKLLLFSCGLSLLFAFRSLSFLEKDKIYISLVIIGLAICCFSIYQYFYLFPKIIHNKTIAVTAMHYFNQKRINYPLFTPNTLASLLIMIIPLAFSLRKGLWLALPLITILILTQSIGALFSLFIAVLILYRLLKRAKKNELRTLIGFAITILIVALIRTSAQNHSYTPLYSSIMRLNYWHDTFQIIRAYPLTGIGLGNFDLYSSRYSHNSYLQIWAEMGIFGLAFFVSIIFCSIKIGLEKIKENPNNTQAVALLCASSAFLIHNLVDFTLFLPEVSIIWFVLLGLLGNKSKPI